MLENKLTWLETACFYVVANTEGKLYAGEWHWTDDLNKARVFARLALARSTVTRYANLYPDRDLLQVVKLAVGKISVLREEERVQEARDRHKKQQARAELRLKQWQLKKAQQDLTDAQQRLDRYQNHTGE